MTEYKPGDKLLGGSVTIGPDGKPGPQICPECGYEDDDEEEGFGSGQSMSGCECPSCGWTYEGDDDMEDAPPCPQCGGMLSGTPYGLKCVPPPDDIDWDSDPGYKGSKPGGCGWSGSDADARSGGKTTSEAISFDKFMDKILISEGAGRKAAPVEISPQRIRAARHQDRPLNKTRYGVK